MAGSVPRWSRTGAGLVVLAAAALLTPGRALAASADGQGPQPANRDFETRVCSGCTPPLVYQSGRVMGTSGSAGEVTVTPIYWSPDAPNDFPGTYVSVVNQYLDDVAKASGATDNVYSVPTEYSETVDGQQRQIAYTMHFGGEQDDARDFPNSGCAVDPGYSRCITDAQLRTELTSYLQDNQLPADLGHLYAVFFPPGIETRDASGGSSAASYCGYHGDYTTDAGHVIYANEPYAEPGSCGGGQSPNNNPAADAEISTLSHEVVEAVTDPGTPGGYTDNPSGNEIGDECSGNFGDPSGSTDANNADTTRYNQVINGHKYYTQTEFSNSDYASGTFRGCAQSADGVQGGSTDASTSGAQPALAFTPKTANSAQRVPPPVPAHELTVEASQYSLPADGSSTSTLTVDVNDRNGQEVVNDAVSFTVASVGETTKICGKLSTLLARTNSAGKATVTYTASANDVACDVVATEGATGQSDQATIYQGTSEADAPTISLNLPAAVTPGAPPVTFTGTTTNPSGSAITNSRIDLILFGDDSPSAGVDASAVHLSYSDETTNGKFVDVPLDGSTIDGGDIEGYLLPETGATFPAGHTRTTTFRLSLDPTAPSSSTTGSPLSVGADFDQINPANGSEASLAATDSDVNVAGGPATDVPETPFALGLPLLGLGVVAGVVLVVRRRRTV